MSNATQEQISVLLDFLQEHRDLARNYVRNMEGKVRSRRLWAEITEHLNGLGGAVKTATQWQKVWADRKYLAKKLIARRNREASGTGGGPSVVPPLTDTEQKVLQIMGEGFGRPNTRAVIPPFVDENRSPNLPPPDIEQISQEVQEEMATDEDHLYCLPSHSPAAAPRIPTPTVGTDPPPPSSSQARRPRWRPRPAGGNVSGRILKVEEEKRDELTAIKTFLGGIHQEMGRTNNLLSEILNRLPTTRRE